MLVVPNYDSGYNFPQDPIRIMKAATSPYSQAPLTEALRENSQRNLRKIHSAHRRACKALQLLRLAPEGARVAGADAGALDVVAVVVAVVVVDVAVVVVVVLVGVAAIVVLIVLVVVARPAIVLREGCSFESS